MYQKIKLKFKGSNLKKKLSLYRKIQFPAIGIPGDSDQFKNPTHKGGKILLKTLIHHQVLSHKYDKFANLSKQVKANSRN